MTKQPTNDAAIQQWNRIPREALEAMEPDGDFAKRHLINPVLLRMLGDVRGRRVLDAGCGHGYFSRMLAARGAHVTGVEPTDGMFSYAREKEQALAHGDYRLHRYLEEYTIPQTYASDFHRPISAYLNELAALGCRLRELAEPGLDPRTAREAQDTTPGIESYVHLPNFLIVAAERL
ncbi:methyltransferase domain-containing protein [Streptomyces noursei]|uniref:Methyltransferase domain-containing protein n=1 Tax=Streptomyces noursei TaxID=1971 RepID=A0A2N8PH61_STRNR|nr:methyltransferase domain-containing protein [Streptomyces noursei]PNE40384.1 hypothetical protein AOB60_05340 [Streptomyces noursei]